MGCQSVIFSLGKEEYGVPIEMVQEITRFNDVHPLPKAPEYVKGLLSLRGQAIPLIDMHNKFGIKKEKESEFAIIVEIDEKLIGMVVDEVNEVRILDEIAPPPPLINAPFIEGIVNLPDRIILQIIPGRILEDAELVKVKKL